jgi:hypothetical protein
MGAGSPPQNALPDPASPTRHARREVQRVERRIESACTTAARTMLANDACNQCGAAATRRPRPRVNGQVQVPFASVEHASFGSV